MREIRQVQKDGGAVPSPFDCWLLLRSIRTLPYRVRAHTFNAAHVAEFLAGHSRVAEVFYPGLAGHPGHETARRQMADFGGMLSFRVKGGRDAAFAVAARTHLFTRATSLGSYESLIEHRASIEGPESATPEDLLRVSVGLENAEDLVADSGSGVGGLRGRGLAMENGYGGCSSPSLRQAQGRLQPSSRQGGKE